MAEEDQLESEKAINNVDKELNNLLSSYLGVGFLLFLAQLPSKATSLVPKLQSELKQLRSRVFAAEDQLRQMKCRKKEDSKANARVVEIFATQRNGWQDEEKRLLRQIDVASQEMLNLRAKIELMELEREHSHSRIQQLEREIDMFAFMSKRGSHFHDDEEQHHHHHQSSACGSRDDEQLNSNFGFTNSSSLSPSSAADSFWAERPNLNMYQDGQYESFDSPYHMKHFVARRESPWKADGGESIGVSSKLRLLEEGLQNLEKVGISDLSKAPSLLRKQAKRYHSLAGKIDDLCRRMQATDPSEPALGPEFRTQRQTEFLLEAFQLKQRAFETAQKLVALQSEFGRNYFEEEKGSETKLTTKRSFDSIKSNLRQVQRNVEIWLARIIGDLEGVLARDGASRVKEYYISRYPFVQ